MMKPFELIVEPGRIAGEGAEAKPYWLVPLADSHKQERIAQELAGDPVLSGRWWSGKAAEDDRQRLNLDEREWRAGCSCLLAMPCRHAQSLLYVFRAEAKKRPELRFTAAGVDIVRLKQKIRELRAQAVQALSGQEDIVRQALERVEALAKQTALDLEPLLQWRYPDPEFWNRDVSLAAWLMPIMQAVCNEDEGGGANDEPENDGAVDSHIHQRP